MSCCVLVGSSVECLDDDPLRGSGGKWLFRLNDNVGDVTDCDGRNAITPPMLMMMHDVSNIGRLIVAFV